MSAQVDPLQLLPIERWHELEAAFEADGPRGVSGLMALRTQKRLEANGLGYGFQVYCPYGNPNNGMVAFNKKGELNEIIILCPNNNTSQLEASLVNTTITDWNTKVLVPYMPENVRKCIFNVAERLNLDVEAEDIVPNDVFILDKQEQTHGVESLPTYQPISEKDVALVNSNWRNRFEGSDWLFRTLIKANFGYGIYKNEELVSWVFRNEVGALTHLYTLEDHRAKGYAQELMKRLCNSMDRNKKVIAYCRRGNAPACRLYKSLGFEMYHEDASYEIIIQCPRDDTSTLEEALSQTNRINWGTPIVIPCLPDHTYMCIQRVAKAVCTEIESEADHPPHYFVLFEAKNPSFEDIRLPEGVTYKRITEDYIESIDNAWPNRYNGSIWMFNFLINAKLGYGLFNKDELLSCVFINEIGALMHLYTFESHRKKGYAKILLQILCSEQSKQNNNVFGYCHRDNTEALNLYKRINFKILHFVKWGFIKPKQLKHE